MWGLEEHTPWNSLTNPFTGDQPQIIPGHTSCRSIEILDIISGRQNALILAGRPNIGKSTLIRYLQLPPTAPWSWRNELEGKLESRKTLDTIHFEMIDLNSLLVGFRDENDLLRIFVEECIKAVYCAYKPGESYADLTLKGLYTLLTTISNQEGEDARYFLILDNIERLGELYMQLFNIKSETKKPQEYGIALLDKCRAIRTVVDLIDEFKQFGFILSIESLPKARVVDQFTYMPADLARFRTKTLQIYTLSDAQKYLAQPVKDFRNENAAEKHTNTPADNYPLFTRDEQLWILELSGSHPYLLQQCCYYLFQFKAYRTSGTGVRDSEKAQLLSIIYEQISTFLSRTWKRLQEAIHNSTQVEMVEKQFQAFITLCASKRAEDEIDSAFWDNLDTELRYILYSEGIVRSDLFRPVHFPGKILSDYLVQRGQLQGKNKISTIQQSVPVPEHGHWLHITRPGIETKDINLSRLEYRLLKTLIEHAEHCTEQELIQGAWEKGTERSNFTQRLYKLRKKLEEQLGGIDVIENSYGGIYSLMHVNWFKLD